MLGEDAVDEAFEFAGVGDLHEALFLDDRGRRFAGFGHDVEDVLADLAADLAFLDLAEELNEVIGGDAGFQGLLVHPAFVLDPEHFAEHPVAHGPRLAGRLDDACLEIVGPRSIFS